MLAPYEERICEKYSQRDADGYVHCFECPLNLFDKPVEGGNELACKANFHYNRKKQRWEYDE